MKKLKFSIAIIAVLGLLAFTNNPLRNTSLKISVRSALGNLEENVAVQLFPTEEDYRNETNPLTDIQYTDRKGRVKFKDLEPKVYFINAEKGEMNNIGFGVQTDTLIAGKLNKVTIIIE